MKGRQLERFSMPQHMLKYLFILLMFAFNLQILKRKFWETLYFMKYYFKIRNKQII